MLRLRRRRRRDRKRARDECARQVREGESGADAEVDGGGGRLAQRSEVQIGIDREGMLMYAYSLARSVCVSAVEH